MTTQAVVADSNGNRFLNWLVGSEVRAATQDGEQPALDRVAQGCVQCHNGARATHITLKQADTPMQFSSIGMQVNHPVSMNYDDYATARSRNYTPRFALDPNIVLVDGAVTCVSCHRLKDTEELFGFQESAKFTQANWDDNQSIQTDTESCSASSELTVGPRQTDLCLACHAMGNSS